MSGQIIDDQAVYAVVRGALKRVVGSLTSAECTSFAIQSVLNTVHRAVADFSEEWNDRAPTLLAPLPIELRTACFQWLPFRDRLTISHLSRDWRHTMLQIPTLWDTVSAKSLSHETAIALLRAIALRSGSVTLDVCCPSTWPDDDQHVDTLQKLQSA
ncbi:hypothetical protein AURDEDRAFT_175335 [Auricularia subglabra TFB-10046 SS5]|nr:hypothetical protein AURDEDRAFT_175335 [Auricularia subglabra TFB-10046 SS5]